MAVTITPRARSASRTGSVKCRTGGRRGNRAAVRGEDRLVAAAVGFPIAALDVRRQRHVADCVDDGVDAGGAVGPETNEAAAVEAPLEDLGVQTGGT
jgi:hypothetical protein